MNKKILRSILIFFVGLNIQAQIPAPIASYPFNGNANDISANANNGTVNGATLTEDRFGNPNSAYSFDGVDDFIDLGNDAVFNFTDNFSIMGWFKGSFDKTWQAIITKGDATWRVHRYQNANFLSFGTTGTSITDQSSNAAVGDNAWHHFAVTYDGQYKRIYVDGMLDAKVAVTGQVNINNQPVFIGENSERRGRYFRGSIDDIRFYNQTLSRREILDIVPEFPALAAHFPIIGDFTDVVGKNTTTNYVPFRANYYNDFTNESRSGFAPFRSDRFSRSSAYYIDSYTEKNHVQFSGAEEFDLQDQKSIAFWLFLTPINFSNFDAIRQPILSRSKVFDSFADGNYSLELEYNRTSQKYTPIIYLEGVRYVVNKQIDPREWYHFTYTFSRASGMNFYLNGELIQTFAINEAALTGSSNNPLWAGKNHDSESMLSAFIDDIRFYDKELGLAEIQALAPAEPVPVALSSPSLGNFLDFDGLNDYVKVDPNLCNQLSGDFTIEVWVNPDEAQTEKTILEFSYLNTEYFRLTTKSFEMSQIYNLSNEFKNTQIVNFPDIPGFNDFGEPTLSPPIASGEWSHLVVRLETAKQKLTVIINGIEVATNYTNGVKMVKATSSEPVVTSFNTPFTLSPELINGLKYEKFYLAKDWNDRYFDGKIDELKIWNYSKSILEIENDQFRSVDPGREGLITYFTFNQGKAGLDNTNIEGLIELTSNEIARILNFDLDGGQSNFLNDDPILPAITTYSSLELSKLSRSVVTPNQIVTAYISNLNPYNYTSAFVNNEEVEILERTSNSLRFKIPDQSKFGPSVLQFASTYSFSRPYAITVIKNDIGNKFSFTPSTLETDFLEVNDLDFIDFNQDGSLDIVALSNDKLMLYENDNEGGYKAGVQVFVNAIPIEGGTSLCIADYSRDGFSDIAISGSNGPKVIIIDQDGMTYLQNMSTTGYTPSGSGNVNVADINMDGYLDLVISYSGNDGGLFYYKSSRIGVSSGLVPIPIRKESLIFSYDFGDINGDGYLDLIIGGGNISTSKAYEYIHNGVDALEFSQEYTVNAKRAETSIISDFDNDGDNDVFFSSRFSPSIWLENIDGVISQNPVATLNGGSREAISMDYDGDGDEDIIRSKLDGIVINEQNSISSKSFSEGSLANYFIGPRTVIAQDFDVDGDLDFAVAYSTEGVIEIYYHDFSANDFLNFHVRDSVTEASVNKDAHTVDLTVKNNTVLTNIIPRFEISEKAIITLNGAEQISRQSEVNFTDPVSYKITAEDGTVQNWTVSLNPLPETPQITEVDDITQTNAEIEWTESSYADFYVVEISEGEEFEEISQSIEIEGTEYVATLSPGLNYSIRVKAVNAFGESADYSEAEEIDMIPGDPEISSITEITTVAALADWQAVRGAEQYSLDVARDSLFTSFVGGYNERIVGSLSESIIGLRAGTRYWLKLRASNETGISGNSDTLSFLTLPEPPQLFIEEVEQTSLSIRWESATAVDGYQIEMESDTDLITVEFDSDVLSINLDTLQAAKEYAFRISARNESGLSAYSAAVVALTKAATPSQLSVTNVAELSADFGWGNVNGADYYLLDVSDDNFSTLLSSYNAKRINGNAESMIGLRAGTRYWLKLRAVNETGISGNSDTLSFLTLSAPPEISINNIEQSSLNISWKSMTIVDSYLLELVSGSDTTIMEFESSVLQLNLDTLQTAKEYAFRVSAENASGLSAFSDPVVALTKAATPSDMKAVNIAEQSANLQWENVDGAEYYLLDVSDDNFSSLLASYNAKRINSNEESLEDLDGGEQYYLRLKSVNATGESPYSANFSFKTVPEVPVARNATGIESNGFTANWDKVDGDGISYVIVLSLDAETEQVVQTDTLTALSFDYTALNDKNSYWYQVKALNESGESNFSNTVAVTRALNISNLTYPDTKSRNDAGDVTVAFEVGGGLNDYNVKLRYKGILEDSWQEIQSQTTANQLSFTIENNSFDALGLNFEIMVNDGKDEVSEQGYSIYLTDTETKIPSLTLEKKWQIFSIPYNFGDNLIETIFDEMGPYEYKSEWRLVQFDGQQYVDAGEGINRIELGESYWFYSSFVEEIVLEGASIHIDNNYEIELREGWNQVGNPYNVPINWDNVREDNNAISDVEQAVLYDPSNENFTTGSIIPVFGGAFVWSNTQRNIQIDYKNSNALRSLGTENDLESDIDGQSWEFEIYLDEMDLALATVGMHPTASYDKDAFDLMKIPGLGKYTEAFSYHPDYFYPYFRKDIRKTADSESWLFEYHSSAEIGKRRLHWLANEISQSSKALWLIDEENGQLVDMQHKSSYNVWLKEGHQFSIHLTAGPHQKPSPFRMSVSDPFPNPAENFQKLNLSLPANQEDYTVNLTITSVEGRAVFNLKKEHVPSGILELEIALGALNLKAGSMYFYQIDVQSEEKLQHFTKKFIYNR